LGKVQHDGEFDRRSEEEEPAVEEDLPVVVHGGRAKETGNASERKWERARGEGERSVCIYRDTGEVASMRGAREPRGARNLSLVGHDGTLQFDRSVSFQANSKDTENTTETAHFPILFLLIRLSIDFGARDKTVYLREVNKIALRIQS
jgi:hypothetical protein